LCQDAFLKDVMKVIETREDTRACAMVLKMCVHMSVEMIWNDGCYPLPTLVSKWLGRWLLTPQLTRGYFTDSKY